MEKLKELSLKGTGIKYIPPSIENLVGLEILMLSDCENLEYVPTSIYKICNLLCCSIGERPRFPSFPGYGFSSLPVLDPSGTTIGKLALYISQMLQESKCRSGSCADENLFLFLKCVDGLEYKLWTNFAHCECKIFYVVHRILMIRNFHSEVLLPGERGESGDPGISFCYSGNKIPHWFTNQSMGSSMFFNIFLLRDRNFLKNYLGFAICIVVNFDQCSSDPDRLELDCECHFKYKHHEKISHKYHWTLPRGRDAHSDDDDDSNLEKNILDRSSDFVFIWQYFKRDYIIYDYVTIEFATFGNHSVKQCGIHPLFRRDAVEFDFTERVASESKNF
ncbi:LRR domain containing protein, partial [Trema orientale]